MKYFLPITGLLTLFVCSIYPQGNANYYSILDSISGHSIYKHLQILADDSLQGRGTGTKGGEIAAVYIANKFEEYKLEKIPNENSYFQNIPMHGSFTLPSSDLMIISDHDTTILKYAMDYYLYRSGQQTFIPAPLQLVFVGYGIVAPEYDYNDYQSVNVEGKIVVFIDGEPESEDADYFKGTAPTIHSYSETKRRVAFSRGAAGSVQIPLLQYENWEAVTKDFNSEDVTLAYTVSGNLSVLVNPEIAQLLFSGSVNSFDDVINMHQQNKVKSFPLTTRIKFIGAFKERDFIASNIIGVVNGSDKNLKDSYLLISAHYDHLGTGSPIEGDSIFNGALDNAIGVSVLLELAKSFSELIIKPKRSILFIATTGEEKGLLGASYYIDNPIFPLYKTIANINIDGIAMFKEFVSIIGVGSEYSSMIDYLDETARRYGLSIEDIPFEFKINDAFNMSDQLAFATAGIPSILVLEGLKNKTKSRDEIMMAFIKYYIEKYHSPFDDLEQNIDPEAAAKHTKILFDLCHQLADQIKVPEWKSGSPFINARLRSIAEER